MLEGLTALANKYRTTPCVGRTYAQHAAPVTFGYKVAVWLAGIAEAADDLPRLRGQVLAASLGGPVGTLTRLGDKGTAVLELFAADLGLAVPVISWHALRQRIAQTGVFLVFVIGALAKMAVDVAHLASTEVGEVAEPHAPGRGGSSAMPHKRNPLSSTVILAAHGAAKGAVLPLLDAMAAQHERALGLWHAEWTALPQLFGLASGALREARRLAEGLVIDAARMRANLELTKGLIFADAVAARLARAVGRDAAHQLVEAASAVVRESGQPLREALKTSGPLTPEVLGDIEGAFDLEPAVEAAARFVDRAIAEAERVRSRLAQPDR
jgi:3-carboxy-cis,cis-muconate cycloisomerase